MKKQYDYATGGEIKLVKFVCPACGNFVWRGFIFPDKPLCEKCGIYMNETDNSNKEQGKR